MKKSIERVAWLACGSVCVVECKIPWPPKEGYQIRYYILGFDSNRSSGEQSDAYRAARYGQYLPESIGKTLIDNYGLQTAGWPYD